MPSTFYPGLIRASTGPSNAVGNTTTETIIIPDLSTSADYFFQGKKLRLQLWGIISNVVTAVPTFTIRVRVGTATLSATWVTTTAAIACNATANTDLVWRGAFEMCCITTGTGGTGLCMGNINLPNITGATSALVGEVMMPVNTAANGNLNTTVVNIISVSAQWSAANAANTIQVRQHQWEEWN